MLTNKGLVEYVKKALVEKWGYVWGTFGQLLTSVLFQQKLTQYPKEVGQYRGFITKNWLNRRVTDCIGLIKGYYWTVDGKIKYDVKTDINVPMMLEKAKEKGPIATIPEIPGLCVCKQGHIGVYIGGGQVIEAAGTTKGVIQTPLKGKGATPWTHWLKCPFITYEEPVKQPTKQEIAVDAALAAGIITDRVYWLKVLNGQEAPKPEYLAKLMENYHTALEKAKKGVR